MFRFFYDWAMLQSTFNSVGGGRYEGEYQEDYVTDMLLLVFDETQHQVMEYRLLNANVKSIEAIDMNWGDQDQLVRLSVTFNYREWHLKTADTTLYSQVNDMIASVDKVLGRSIRIPTGVLDVISLF